MSNDKELDYLKVQLAKGLEPEAINAVQNWIVKSELVCSCVPVFEEEEEHAPYGDKESDAVSGHEVSRLKIEKPNSLLEKMLVGRTVVGVSRRDDDEVDLHFADGSSVNFRVDNHGGQLPDLVISKEMYVSKTVLETVEV